MLSAEKTPTLGATLPAFEALKERWEEHRDEHPNTASIVGEGLDKLQEYRTLIDNNPIYTLATSKLDKTAMYTILLILNQVLNPAEKLDWFIDHAPEKVRYAKQLVSEKVSIEAKVPA